MLPKGTISKPAEWNMLSHEGIFVLKAKESVTLLFKFLTFRTIASDTATNETTTNTTNNSG